MSEQQQIRDALADIESALKEHRIYPAYDDNEMETITALQEQLEARLQLTEQENPQ